MGQMNVSLTDQLAEYVRARVKSGRYNSASEVVRESLRRMQQDDERAQRLAAPTVEDVITDLTAEQIEGIRKRVLQGIRDIENGRYVEIRNRKELREFMGDVKERGRRRLREHKR
jgi:putative addiction module CopG family antidote